MLKNAESLFQFDNQLPVGFRHFVAEVVLYDVDRLARYLQHDIGWRATVGKSSLNPFRTYAFWTHIRHHHHHHHIMKKSSHIHLKIHKLRYIWKIITKKCKQNGKLMKSSDRRSFSHNGQCSSQMQSKIIWKGTTVLEIVPIRNQFKAGPVPVTVYHYDI